MKIIFAGTPNISAEILKHLLTFKNIEILACYTQPDRESGRGKKISFSPVKELAISHNIPVFQPKSLRNEEALLEFKEMQADLVIVVAYGLIIPENMLAIPQIGFINIHTSILPEYRGAAPITHAILNGDSKTGVSLMVMDKGMDTGPVISQLTCDIDDNETTESLTIKLTNISKTLLSTFIPNLIKTRSVTSTPQDHNLASYAPKISTEHGNIAWQKTAIEIERMVRAYTPWPNTYSHLNGVRIKIHQAHVVEGACDSSAGTVCEINANYIKVSTGKDWLCITKLQFPGKNIITALDVLNSNKIKIKDVFHLT